MEGIDKAYARINKYWKNINRDMVAYIIDKFADIAEIYEETHGQDWSDRDRQQFRNSLLTTKIHNNESLPEAATFNTILSFVVAMYHFLFEFDNNFSEKAVWDYLLCQVHEFSDEMLNQVMFNGKKRYQMIIDDEELPKMFWWFKARRYEAIRWWMEGWDRSKLV